MENSTQKKVFLSSALPRRSFLRYAGAGIAGVALAATGCEKAEAPVAEADVALNELSAVQQNNKPVIVLGSGDTALWNFAYVLEQIEVAFYTELLAKPYRGMNSEERMYFTEILDHEIAHRETLKAVIGNKAIPNLEIYFPRFDFNNRNMMLDMAIMIEGYVLIHLGGVMELSNDDQFLRLVNKILSNDARHLTVIRELISPDSYMERGTTAGLQDTDYRTKDFITTLNGYLKNVKLDNQAIENINA